jgi:hypothetical protein
MALSMLLMIAALLASLVLVADVTVRGHALGAVVASGLDLAIAQGLTRLYIVGVPLEKVIPGALLLFGLLMLLGLHSKPKKLLAAVVLVVGALLLGDRMGWV